MIMPLFCCCSCLRFDFSVFAAMPRCVAAEKRPKTQNEARLARTPRTERNEAGYAVVRPIDVADDDDVSGDYAYPAAPVPDHNRLNSSAQYLELIPEPEDPLQP